MARKGHWGNYKVIILKNAASVSNTLTVDTGVYVVTGNDVVLNVSRSLAVDVGSYVVTGNSVDLIYTPVVPPTPTEQTGDGVRKHEQQYYRELREKRRKQALKEDEVILISAIEAFKEIILN